MFKVSRGGSRGVSQVSRNNQVYRTGPIHTNKTVKIYGQNSNKAVVTLLITSIYMLILFTRGGFRGGSKWS